MHAYKVRNTIITAVCITLILKCPYLKFLPISAFTMPNTVLAKKHKSLQLPLGKLEILATGKRTDGTFGILGKLEKQFQVGG